MLLTYIFGLEWAEIQRFPRNFSLSEAAPEGLPWRWGPLARVATMATTVRMYSRRTCGLCDDARAVILAVRGRRSFEFEEILIDGDDSLERNYGLRVPVVEVDDVEQFEFTVDRSTLELLVTDPSGT
jgi:glutaredoxin